MPYKTGCHEHPVQTTQTQRKLNVNASKLTAYLAFLGVLTEIATASM